jgi:CDP-glycerol glycerophosphotransferase (TagB/SpsB family)
MVVVDSAEWITHGKFQLAFRSKVIQLWHGAPLKEIEIPLFLRRIAGYPKLAGSLLKAYKIVTGRHAAYELVVSTSDFFTEKAFKPAFRARHFIDTGYPRNDALFADVPDGEFHSPLWINTDLSAIIKIIARKKAGAKTILYAPTFRKTLADPFSSEIFALNRMNEFAAQHNLLLILKLHPVFTSPDQQNEHANILIYKATCDIYPALNLFDALVTDYSSIYFDFLLVNRPIIFYPYDYEEYIKNDRSLLFNYEHMTPGPICKNQDELEEALRTISEDCYQKKRKEILDLVFTHKVNGASTRLWNFLEERYIFPGSPERSA